MNRSQSPSQDLLSLFPRTRYQGSKYKLLPWIRAQLESLSYGTVLDAFGGTAAVSFLFKTLGKTVYYNDLLKFNSLIGKALIENQNAQLSDKDIATILKVHPRRRYDDLIARTFHGIYYTDEENKWLDVVVQNILAIEHSHKQAMAFWALFQAAMSKRPYNLFHRKNLYVRTSHVKRSFGNKTTWDRPFEDHFRGFVAQINAAIFDNGCTHRVLCQDVHSLDVPVDLVYIDPPYIPQTGTLTRYRDFYHFLEGMVEYPEWEGQIDLDSKHKRLQPIASPWEEKAQVSSAFEQLFSQFRASILAISYRKDGIPSIDALIEILRQEGRHVEVREIGYQYALSKKSDNKEVLLIAHPASQAAVVHSPT